MEIKILGAHNTESAHSRLAGVLIDGALALDAGSITSSLSLEEQLELKAVLLTHRHYDHIRDVPALGMNLYLKGKQLPVYAPPDALETLSCSILNGRVYSQFTHKPADKPTLIFKPVYHGEEFTLNTYQILPITMPHSVPAVGYLITDPGGASVFYTGDTGCGFAENIAFLKPDVLIVETTAPNRYGDSEWSSKHLTPAFLEKELVFLKNFTGRLPQIFCVHMYQALEEEIKAELSQVAGRLGTEITPAWEGMVISL